MDVLANTHGIAAAPITPQMFASAGKEHMQKYGEGCFVPIPPCSRSLVPYRDDSRAHGKDSVEEPQAFRQ